MTNAKSIALFLLTAVIAVTAGVRADDAPTSKPVKTAVAEVEASGNAASRPTDNHVSGTVTFTTVDGGVKFVADIDGFEPNESHGFHIHEKGDLTAPDLKSAGGHYNPTKEKHGGPEALHHHAGDLGNLKSDANGHAHLEGTVKGVSLGGENSILDRSVIIHADADDLKSQPAGNSGDRIAGGVIKAKAD
jgi:Cu-Zn family superoxide dismutase